MKGEKFLTSYFNLQKVLYEEYPKKSLLLMQKGLFYEIYAMPDDPLFSEVCDLLGILQTRVDKSLPISINNPRFAGFPIDSANRHLKALTENEYTVRIVDETKEGKLVLADLFNHPFVKNPKTFTDGLYDIKMAFFGDKAGLIYFLNGKAMVSANMSEFATTESSQDGYRFGLKARNKGKAYIEKQK